MKLNLDKSKLYMLGFSGGADSALLAFLLKEQGYSFRLIHVNHKCLTMASKDCDEIQKFCEAWAKTYKVPLLCESIVQDLSALSIKQKGPESAERDARYAIFKRKLLPDEVLLTGHHLNDSIENVLFRICRGTSAAGLTGIKSSSDFSGHQLVRPFSRTTKAEIISQCEDAAVLYRHDSTNDDTSRSRGFIRNKVVPLLEQHFSASKFYASLERFMENMSECSEITREMYAIDFSTCRLDENRVWLGYFWKLPEVRQRNFMHHFISDRTGVFLAKSHINEILKKLQSHNVLRINVGGVVVYKSCDGFFHVSRLNKS